MKTTDRNPFQRTFTGNPAIRDWHPNSVFNAETGTSQLAGGGKVQIIARKVRTFNNVTLSSTNLLIEIMERLGVNMQGGIIEIATRYATEVDSAPAQVGA